MTKGRDGSNASWYLTQEELQLFFETPKNVEPFHGYKLFVPTLLHSPELITVTLGQPHFNGNLTTPDSFLPTYEQNFQPRTEEGLYLLALNELLAQPSNAQLLKIFGVNFTDPSQLDLLSKHWAKKEKRAISN